jgi:glycosyltransferase involved in cell wall biosynthesis
MTNLRRKKILFVRTTLGYGGADRVAVNLIKNFPRQYYDVRLLLMKYEGFYLHEIDTNEILRSKSVKSLWHFLIPLYKTIRKENPDVVFSLDGGVNILLGLTAPFYRRNQKIILSERNVLLPPGKNKLKRILLFFLKWATYRFADLVTAVSYGVKQELEFKLHLKPHRVKVVYNPVIDIDFTEKQNEPVDHPWFVTPRDIPVVVHAGRFVYQKDHDTLLRAFVSAAQKVDCRLFLLGEGPLLDHFRDKVKLLGIEDRVFFAGFDSNPFKYFSRSDLFVLSSRHEGMPGVLIQAMACGVPVISTDCPHGPSEIIDQPGCNGVLVRVGDAEGLANAMICVLTNSTFAHRLRSRGQASAYRFTVKYAVQSYIDAIEQA